MFNWLRKIFGGGCDHNHANDGFYVPRVSADELSGRI